MNSLELFKKNFSWFAQLLSEPEFTSIENAVKFTSSVGAFSQLELLSLYSSYRTSIFMILEKARFMAINAESSSEFLKSEKYLYFREKKEELSTHGRVTEAMIEHFIVIDSDIRNRISEANHKKALVSFLEGLYEIIVSIGYTYIKREKEEKNG